MQKRLALFLLVALLGVKGVSAAEGVTAAADLSCLYFAHPINTYGTALEKKLLARISKKFPGMRVLNPSEPAYSEGWGRYRQKYGNPMLYFTLELMPSCAGGVIGLPYRDGKWSPGVYLEMMEMYVAGRSVWTIDAHARIRRASRFPSGLLSIEANKAYAHKPF